MRRFRSFGNSDERTTKDMDEKAAVLYAQAEQEYIKCIGILHTLCRIKDGTLDKKRYMVALSQFETALQGVMLYAAFADRAVTETELRFVTGVTITGNILAAANAIGPRRLYRRWVPLTWENISSDELPTDSIPDIIAEAIDAAVLSFVQPIAEVDRDISSHNYIAELSQSVSLIVNSLCFAEKDADGEESARRSVAEAMRIYDRTFKSYWGRFANKYDTRPHAYYSPK